MLKDLANKNILRAMISDNCYILKKNQEPFHIEINSLSRLTSLKTIIFYDQMSLTSGTVRRFS